jgi:hypothetical protein
MAKAEAEELVRDLVSLCPHTLVMYTPHTPSPVAGADPTYEQRHCCLCGLHESEGSFRSLVTKQGRLFKVAMWRDIVTQAQDLPLDQLLEEFVTPEQRSAIATLLGVK